MSYQQVIVVGHLGQDPEMRHTGSGTSVANFSVATNEKWTDKEGQKQERVEWHRCIAWGKTAEVAAEYLRKGRQVMVTGRLQTREWEDRDGQKRWTTEIVCDRVVFLSGGGGGDRDGERYNRSSSAGSKGDTGRDQSPPNDDDIPF